MSNLAREILPPSDVVHFWLDTLCCPPDSMNRPEEQGTALDLMRDTYAEAQTVLVLDRWLLRQDLCSMPLLDALFRIICSPWTRRLWTLQEGALAHRIFLQGADGFLEVDTAMMEISKPTDDVNYLNVRSDIMHRWYTIRGFKDLEAVDLFRALYPSLAFRTTSILEDEPLYLATLFKLPIAPIAELKTHEERMQALWSKFKVLPAEVMDHYEPRLQIPGFRWAPRSFMSDDENLFPYSHKMMQHGHWPPAIPTDQGLELVARGYYIHIKDWPLIGPVFVRNPAGF